MKIQESAENYLEAVLILSRKNPYVRSIDIASELVSSKPNISMAMKNLRENGYIFMDDQGHIAPSSMGEEITETMYERHTMLSRWPMYLGVDEQTTTEDACRIEHVINTENFRAIKNHIIKGHELPEDNL